MSFKTMDDGQVFLYAVSVQVTVYPKIDFYLMVHESISFFLHLLFLLPFYLYVGQCIQFICCLSSISLGYTPG